MEEIKLDVQVRAQVGGSSVRAVRREDAVPGIVYGGKKEPTAIKLDRRTFERIRRQHQVESVVFHLNVLDGEKKLRDYSAIVKEEQLDPVTDKILHVDFKRISLKEEIEVKVPIVAKGEPVGVKQDNGSLEHVIWELDVVCLPTIIPQHLDVDVSGMKIGDTIQVKDIVMPAGVVTKHEPESIIFHVAPPMKEEDAAGEEEKEEEPELIKDKKEKDAGGEAEKAQEKAEG